jgi:hypothetical protein
MNATVLWIVLIGSVALVLAALGYFVARLWHLIRVATRIARATGAAVGPLTTGSAFAAEQTAVVSGQAADIAAKFAHLRLSLARLNVATAALHEGRAPFARVLSYISK